MVHRSPSNGLEYPGDPAGDAEEVINCRCALLQRAKWALDDEFTKRNNFTGQLETFQNPASYAEFKQGFFSKENRDYMNYVQKMERRHGTKNFSQVLERMSAGEYRHYSGLLERNPMFKSDVLELAKNNDKIAVNKVLRNPIKSSEQHYDTLLTSLNQQNVQYNPVAEHNQRLSESEIIAALSGGDKTQGSCASLGLAYIGQKQGWDVLDFRGGDSRNFFSNSLNLSYLSEASGLKVLRADGKKAVTVGKRLLKQCETGKEYYLSCGRHAAIVRRLDDGKLQYLELQSAKESGWKDFNEIPILTLSSRFGCTTSLPSVGDFMIDIKESNFSTDDFKSLLGYINTEVSKQKKGKYGTIK